MNLNPTTCPWNILSQHQKYVYDKIAHNHFDHTLLICVALFIKHFITCVCHMHRVFKLPQQLTPFFRIHAKQHSYLHVENMCICVHWRCTILKVSSHWKGEKGCWKLLQVYLEKESLLALPLSSTIGHKLAEVASRKQNLTSSIFVYLLHTKAEFIETKSFCIVWLHIPHNLYTPWASLSLLHYMLA